MKFSIKDFFSKCDQILSFLWILSHLLKKSLTENFIFCAVLVKRIFVVMLIDFPGIANFKLLFTLLKESPANYYYYVVRWQDRFESCCSIKGDCVRRKYWKYQAF